MAFNVYWLIVLGVLIFVAGGCVGVLIACHVLDKDRLELYDAYKKADDIATLLLNDNRRMTDWIDDIPDPCTDELMKEHKKKYYEMVYDFNKETKRMRKNWNNKAKGRRKA